MKIGLVGPSYLQRSSSFDAQRTINLFPVFDNQGKEVAALYGTDGLEYFSQAGNGPIRNSFYSTNGRAFFVSGNALYEVTSEGVSASLGTLLTTTGMITIDENPTQLFIVDGTYGYILTYSTNAFSQITDSDFPLSGSGTYLGGYFIVNQNSTGKFFISKLSDGTSWAALDYATAESSPDNLKRVMRGLGQLWLFGDKTTEIWSNTGNASFPFQRISGAEIPVGLLSPASVREFSSSMFWVSSTSEGSGVVVRATSYTPERISTDAIEFAISKATSPEDIYSWSYQRDGHEFYCLSGGGLETTLCYDLTTSLWHERAYLESNGSLSPHLASSCIFAFNSYIVGDRRNGKLYKLKTDVYSDNGDAISRRRVFTHLSSEGKQIRYNSLTLGFEAGTGLQTGQGSNPIVSLRLSKDGARTWSDSYTASIGAVGKYQTNVVFRRLGISDILTISIEITDPVKVAIIGSYLD